MSLARFILDSKEDILTEWQRFAETISSSSGLDRVALRDDAAEMLSAIARDMQTSQSALAQEKKSQGGQPAAHDAPDTAAESHGVQRFMHGFDLDEMVSEYRALRASVIRLWITGNTGQLSAGSLYELTRFNEGIDQALAESVQCFSDQLNRSRELFMGVLGHDLRTPLHVILNSSTKLLRGEVAPDDRQRFATYIRDSAQLVSDMVNDLLDVTRTRLGGELPLRPEQMDANGMCQEVLQQFRVLHPQREIGYVSSGELRGRWDKTRLHQLLTNLLRNAIQHGDAQLPVTLTAKGNANDVQFLIHNRGEPIASSVLRHIFEPMKRGNAQDGPEDSGSLGLGLYIADTIVRAHLGTLTVESSEQQGTTFSACLPRKALPSAVDH